MKRYALYLVLVLLSVIAFAESPESFDWPQWQGPDRNAVSKERGLLKEWTKDGPPLAWKITGLGGGESAPSIAAGRVFGMSNRGKDEVVWALSETARSFGNAACSTILAGAYQPGVSANRRSLMVIGSSAPRVAKMRLLWLSTS